MVLVDIIVSMTSGVVIVAMATKVTIATVDIVVINFVLVIVANQLTDLAYRWIDPRLRGR
jgi:ABC-type dipeptide/oligopeptide/nickel transport system permease component